MASNHVSASAPALPPPPPPPVTASPPVFSGLPSDYAAWNAHFACVLRLSKLADDADKSAMLFCALAPTAQRTLMALISPKTVDDVNFEELRSALDRHYRVSPLPLAEYFKFFAARQDPDQSSADYVIQLRTLAASCSWPISLDRALAIVFVMGVSSNKLRQQLLQKDYPSIDLALEQANQYDSILRETLRTSISRPASSADLAASVNQVRGRSKSPSAAPLPCDRCARSDHSDDECRYRQAVCNSCSKVGHIARACRSKPRPSQRLQSPQQSQPSQRRSSPRGRRRRGYAKTNKVTFSVDAIRLPSSDATARPLSDRPPPPARPLSDRPPPFAQPLFDRPPSNDAAAARPPAVRRLASDADARLLAIDNDAQLRSSNDSVGDNRPFMIDLQIEGRPARLEVDTGAAVTVINSSLWRDLGKPRLKKSSAVCRSFTGEKIAIRGQAAVHVDYEGKSTLLQMLVAENGDSVLGRPWIRALHIVDLRKLCDDAAPYADVRRLRDDTSMQNLLNSFPQVFQPGLGHCTKMKAHLALKNEARPTFIRPRPLPYAVYDATTAELERLIADDVIAPIDYSDWAAPVVIVAKAGGKIRLCADFSTGLNDSLDVHQYPLPRPADLFHRLNGGKIFSKIDFSDAYLQLELDDESKKIVVINTHKGLFRYNRLPFGVASAPALFQQVMERMLAGIPGVGVYLDDVIVTAADESTHLQRLRQVLARIQDYGFRVRKEKCEWAKERIDYLGFVIDAHGRHTSQKKTAAIAAMPAPKNLHELRALLGLINHYASFLPRLSSRLSSLHALLRQDDKGKYAPFFWSSQCQQAFEEVKKDLLSPLMLTHYDPRLPIILSADASPVGVGAVIAHRLPDGREIPIAHASKTLTPTESRYPQIEKEALALIFGVTKFHQYVYGRRFILRTDHQPLVKIFGSKRGLPTTSVNRLQNYGITLMSYVFDIEYVRSENFGQADGLSRLPQADDGEFQKSRKCDAQLRAVYSEKLRELPVKADAVREATKKDALLQLVTKYHRLGWPDRVSGSDKERLLPYFRIRSELAIAHDCLLWGLRTIVPDALRPQVLQQLHATHPGKSAMQRLARRFFWWPGLDADIERLVSDCDPCIQRLPDPTPVPPQPWPRVDRPWKRIHIDFAGPFLGAMWLIVIDAYSRWPEVVEMQVGHTTTSSVIFALSTMFSRYGFAETLVSDNGRQFTSDAFAEWCRSHGVTHQLTTPYHPSSNGLAERFVGTFKQAMLKGGEEEEEKKVCLLKFLQRYRITPHPATDQAPAELFLGRTPRSQFDLLFPTDLLAAEKTKEKDKLHDSRSTKEKKIAIGAAVLIRRYKGGQPAGWVRGTVVGRRGSVVWEVKPCDRDEVWRRHSDQLRLARTMDDPAPQDDSDLPYDSAAQHDPEPQHDPALHYAPEPLYYSAPLFDPVPQNDPDRQVDLTVPERQSALLDAPAAAEQASSPPSANPLSDPPKDSDPPLSTPSAATQQTLRRSTRVRRPAQVFAPE